MKTTLTRPAIVALTLVAVLLLALAPAQLALRKAVGSSLYPALMMPSFGAQDPNPDAVTTREFALIGVDGDGNERKLAIDSVLPRSQTLPMTIAVLHFPRRSVMTDPETVAWLGERIELAYPDERFVAVRVVWSDTTIAIPSGRQSSTVDEKASFTIDLRKAEGADDR